MPKLRFESTLFEINSWTLLVLPKNVSAQLPSRGMVMIEGTINGFSFQSPLEPDGRGSHWLEVDNNMLKATSARSGDTVTLVIEPSSQWPEPKVPEDLNKALSDSSQARVIWMNITPMARWDWIRWIRSTKQPETRKKRIKTTCAKLNKGIRRPCCFNRNLCSEPYVSKNWELLIPN